MKINVVSIFPGYFEAALATSIVGRVAADGLDVVFDPLLDGFVEAVRREGEARVAEELGHLRIFAVMPQVGRRP